MQKVFQERIIQRGIVGEDHLWSGGGFWSSEKLQFASSRQKAADYVKMLNDLSLAQEGRRLCGEECIFQQDNAALHNASIIKKYLLEQKTRLFDPLACFPDFNTVENLRGLIFLKEVDSTQQFLNSKTLS